MRSALVVLLIPTQLFFTNVVSIWHSPWGKRFSYEKNLIQNYGSSSTIVRYTFLYTTVHVTVVHHIAIYVVIRVSYEMLFRTIMWMQGLSINKPQHCFPWKRPLHLTWGINIQYMYSEINECEGRCIPMSTRTTGGILHTPRCIHVHLYFIHVHACTCALWRSTCM